MERPDDVGLDELPRPIDRTIHMAFGRKVQDRIGLGASKQGTQSTASANIQLVEFIRPIAFEFRKRV
jgi:hypothetical protein